MTAQDMSKEEILKYIDNCVLTISKHVEPTGIIVHNSVMDILDVREYKGLLIEGSIHVQRDYIYITTAKPDLLWNN